MRNVTCLGRISDNCLILRILSIPSLVGSHQAHGRAAVDSLQMGALWQLLSNVRSASFKVLDLCEIPEP